MSLPILVTKLAIPASRPRLVSRARLLQHLQSGLAGKLTLISAPAGYGKTTLLSEWCRQSEHPIAWLSLDESDNDPTRFMNYLLAALQTVEDLIQSHVVESRQPPSIENFIAKLVNSLANYAAPVVLVLDDYHLITNPKVHQAINLLLANLPSNTHLIISSRADPPLPLARLRAREELAEVRLADLRFTPTEAAEFISSIMGIQLAADEMQALARRTEGWIAGLQLAAVSMQDRDDLSRFIREFTGSNRYILDYLVEEVLQRQPGEIYKFLLNTSILERLTASLCDSLIQDLPEGDIVPGEPVESGEPVHSAHHILDYLDRSNLFLIPLDDRREWYRYHRLFSSLLRQRLQQDHPERVAWLHARASSWFEGQGLLSEAIEHALTGKDFERAAHLILQEAENTLKRSELVTYTGWLEQLPHDLLRAHPNLCIYQAWALLMSGQQMEAVDASMRIIQDASENIQMKALPLRALVAFYQGRLSEATEISRQALKILPPDEELLRSFSSWIFEMTKLVDLDLEARGHMFDQIARKSQMEGNLTLAVLSLTSLAEVRYNQGRLGLAKTIYEQALQLALSDNGNYLPIAGEALIGLAELAREADDLQAAQRYIDLGYELASRYGQVSTLGLYLLQARIWQTGGDYQKSLQSLQQARQLAESIDTTQFDDWIVDFYQTKIALLQGNLDSVAHIVNHWIRQEQQPEEAEQQYEEVVRSRFRKYRQITIARWLLAHRRAAQALEILEQLLPAMEQQGRVGLVIEIYNLITLAYQALGESQKALQALRQALTLAEQGAYLRIFLDEGPELIRLLHLARQRRIMPGYIDRILSSELELKDQTARPSPQDGVGPSGIPYYEPLSERELEVLKLLTTSLSGTEIAQELFIAPSTVRSHIKSIYSKLNVHNRGEAVRRASELKFL
ncbi:MAG TPA: LuxR C-terminal-related transcriptional regulator [Anaerolineales bacterium]|nr:LuxR C-terminal-related transcriptional regulator [Anaerolineales bacterium]